MTYGADMQTNATATERKNNKLRLTFKERIELVDLMRPHIRQSGEYCEYVNGMTDAGIVRISENDRVTVGHVQHLRLDVFGKTHERSKASPSVRLIALEKRMNELEKLVLSLSTKN